MIKLNFNNIIYDVLPPSLRNIVNFQWLQVLIRDVRTLWDDYYQYTIDNDYEIKHQSQVLLFEQYLDYHVPNDSGVNIGDGSWLNYNIFWFQSEIDQPSDYDYFQFDSESITGFTNPFLYFESEYGLDSYDFTVDYYSTEPNVDIEDDLTIWVEKLRLAGSTYIFRQI